MSEFESDSVDNSIFQVKKEESRCIRWRDITFYVIPNAMPGKPNILFAKVTIEHTKGENLNPTRQAFTVLRCSVKLRSNRKKFLVEAEDDPILCLLDHLLVMAFYDGVFKGPVAKDLNHIFEVNVPKNSLRLPMNEERLDKPVFRQPERDTKRTSLTEPLKASTWLRYLKRLGRNSGLQQSFTQYCARRGSLNAVNSRSHATLCFLSCLC